MSFRRPNWLAELQGAVGVALIVLAGIAVFQVVTLASGGMVVTTVPAEVVTGVAGATDGLVPGAVVEGEVEVRIADPAPGQLAMYELTSLPVYLVVATVLVLLWTTLRRARREDPFTAATVRRLRVIGWVALAGGVVAQLGQMLAALELSSQVIADGSMTATLDLLSTGLFLLVGYGFFAVAEILNRGLAMRAELETVI
jgi:hypothetical protein